MGATAVEIWSRGGILTICLTAATYSYNCSVTKRLEMLNTSTASGFLNRGTNDFTEYVLQARSPTGSCHVSSGRSSMVCIPISVHVRLNYSFDMTLTLADSIRDVRLPHSSRCRLPDSRHDHHHPRLQPAVAPGIRNDPVISPGDPGRTGAADRPYRLDVGARPGRQGRHRHPDHGPGADAGSQAKTDRGRLRASGSHHARSCAAGRG